MKKRFSAYRMSLILLGFAILLAACVRPTPGSEDIPTPAPLPTMAPVQPTVPPTVVPDGSTGTTTDGTTDGTTGGTTDGTTDGTTGGTTEGSTDPGVVTEATAVPPTDPGQGGSGQTVHVVAPGDTLFSISQRYGVSVDAIMAANNITNPNILIVGQQLIIPAPGTTPPTTGEQVHTVQAGENLFRIGLNYGCTVDQLVQYNGLPSADAIIYVGDQILIPPDC